MRQMRIAVVMNGGISLAVWMGGVTHELSRLTVVGAPEAHGRPDRPVDRAWRAVLEHASTRVVVDTIAGTSAGGLNGTLLATTVACGSDLDGLRDIWLTSASLAPGRLLRSDPSDATTLLDGDYFTDRINDAVREVSQPRVRPAGEVTLLVTATGIGANLVPVRLEDDGRDAYRDSRRVFRFRRRLTSEGVEMRNDFDPAQLTARSGAGEPSGPLTRAARASASYPVAFAPVWEDETLSRRRVPGSAQVPRTPLMDGGVLDNAPFGPVLQTLRQRPVDAPFDRILLYVVPSIGRRPIAHLGHEDLPDVGKVVRALLPTIQEPDQRLDTEMLASAFAQMAQSHNTPHAVLSRLLSGDAVGRVSMRVAARALFETYRVGRAEALPGWLAGLGPGVDLTRPVDHVVDPDSIPGVPRIADGEQQLQPGTPWQWGPHVADRVLRWLGRSLVALSSEPGRPVAESELTAAFTSLAQAQRTVGDLRDRVEHEARAAEPATRLVTFARRLHQIGQADSLGTEVSRAAGGIAAWLSATGDEVWRGPEVVEVALQVEVISSVLSPRTQHDDMPRFTYRQVTPDAPSLVDLQLDAQQQADWPAKKLYGERWNHFGAFATEEGRRHDWLWGRLDGASSLARIVLGEDPPQHLLDQLANAILEEELGDAVGANAPAKPSSGPPDDLQAELRAGAHKVLALDTVGLYHLMLAEQHGERTRELLLATIPEVLGAAEGIPPAVEGVVKVLAAAGEAVLDAFEVRDTLWYGTRDLLRRVWHAED